MWVFESSVDSGRCLVTLAPEVRGRNACTALWPLVVSETANPPGKLNHVSLHLTGRIEGKRVHLALWSISNALVLSQPASVLARVVTMAKAV